MHTISPIPTKQELKNWCGYLSFHTAFYNLDLVGIRLKKSGETIMITFRGGKKTGYMYEGGNLNAQDVLQIFNDVPEFEDDIEKMYEPAFEHLVQVIYPKREYYLWLNENEIVQCKKVKK